MANNAHFKCFLGNLSHSTDEQALKKALEHIESFAGVKVMYDKFDGKPRGFGWAYFNDTQGMKAAHALSNRILIHGRAVLIQPPREAPGGGDESGAPPPKKRKPHKPITGAIEIAHAQYAEMDKSAYQHALVSQRRARVVDETAVADMQAGLLLPLLPGPIADKPAQQTGLPARLTVRAKPKAAGQSEREQAATGVGPSGATSVGASASAPAVAGSAIALLQGYGDSDSDD